MWPWVLQGLDWRTTAKVWSGNHPRNMADAARGRDDVALHGVTWACLQVLPRFMVAGLCQLRKNCFSIALQYIRLIVGASGDSCMAAWSSSFELNPEAHQNIRAINVDSALIASWPDMVTDFPKELPQYIQLSRAPSALM